LRDGRNLGFAEYGSTEGYPIIYFHGWPSSRLEAGALHNVCSEMAVRLIAPDRPGLGRSDFLPRRSIPDFSSDVMELAERLGLERFAALGVSGGGPYAAACAARIPQRLSAALLVCSVGPSDAPDATKGMVAVNRWLLNLARHFPRVAQCVAGACLWAIWRKGDQAIPRQIEARLPPADRQALSSADLRRTLTASSVEALRGGVCAAAADGLLYGKPWGFQFQEIRIPTFLWHGEMDVVVPSTMGHYLANHIPGCQARFYPNDGHFSLPFTRVREILSAALD
jgi:pimeloyl-ACP methyl ester carboxylesterase